MYALYKFGGIKMDTRIKELSELLVHYSCNVQKGEKVLVSYEGEECNKPLHIKFEDGNGNEIVAVISPDKVNDTLANSLAINFFDPYNNDESMRGIWVDSIKSTLDEAGHNAGTPTCREGYEVKATENEQIRDIEKTRQKG